MDILGRIWQFAINTKIHIENILESFLLQECKQQANINMGIILIAEYHFFKLMEFLILI